MLSLGGELGRKKQEERDRKWLSISKGQGSLFSMTGMTGLMEKGAMDSTLFISILFELHTNFFNLNLF